MAEKYLYVKLTKEWGGFRVGDVIRFGQNKGMGRIEKGEGVEVKKQRAINDPIIETATLNVKPSADAKAEAKAKAKAEAEAKAKAEAEAKAKAEAEAKTKAEAATGKKKSNRQ